MGELKMRIPVLQHRTRRLLRNVAIVMIAGFGAGCSADMTRFTDGIFTGSTARQQHVMHAQPANNTYAAAPIAAAPRGSAVQRSTLQPVSSAPLAEPAPQAAPVASGSASNPVNKAVSRADGSANTTGTQLASAATAAQGATAGAVNAAREKTLGQLPAGGQEAPGKNLAAMPKTSAAGGGYIVQAGDSLYSIARKHNVPVEQLKKANGLSDGAIRVGQSLIIPAATETSTQVAAVAPKPEKPAETSKVQPVSTPPNAATTEVKPYTPPQASNKVIEEAEKDDTAAPSSTGIQQMRWPVRGRVLASFGQRDGGSVNDGIDIMVPEGTPVKAAENGVVIYAGDGLKEFGQTVLIRHDNGLVTVYGHNSQILVQRGQKVRRGEEIAKSGMSGNAKSPKLHFEVRKNSTPVNPSKYLES
ncbi:peptidoglycan DD-metalloendopeptidase family protein [Daeguia caeni]|uniref:Peptidoglycan DD-metalloendopeptidase family protein n=1 Tax=Daeguia caeni TaxID=439612 RepID=A0ABV9H4M2_9HYPH